MSKEADIQRAADALQAIKALVEANQLAADHDDNVLTLDSVVWRSPRDVVEESHDGPADYAHLKNTVTSDDDDDDGGGIAVDTVAPEGPEGKAEPESRERKAEQADATTNEAPMVAQQPAHLPRDPYAIFELGEPALLDRFATEEVTSRGTPASQAEFVARAAERLRQQQDIAKRRAAQKALAPSPHLQPTAPRTMPASNPGRDTPYADFSLDEHEAMMSTQLPLAQTPRHQQKIDDSGSDSTRDSAGDRASDTDGAAAARPTNRDEAAQTSAAPADGMDAEAVPPSRKSEPKPRKAAGQKTQIPLHVVSDNGIAEGDETNPEDVMRNALRSMIRDQIGNWLEDNISTLIEDALREPAGERKTTPQRNKHNPE